VTGTWVVGPPLQFYEEVFFALYTFSRRFRDLIRATNADTTCFRQGAYIGYILPQMCPNPGLKKCKVGPSLYTDFTPAVRMKAMMRSIIGAVI
jgi:hypothetical protein